MEKYTKIDPLLRDRRWATAESLHLLALARHLAPEQEGIDIIDREYTVEELSVLRSYLSSQRSDIDVVNRALAEAWKEDHRGATYDDGTNTWSLDYTKGKELKDEDAFYDWLTTLDASKLKRLFSGRSVKVGGFTTEERNKHLDETEWTGKYSVKAKWNK